MCTCCSCIKLELFWYTEVTPTWRTWLEPAWGCIPLGAEAEHSMAHLESPGGDRFGYREHKLSTLPVPLWEQAERSGNGSGVVQRVSTRRRTQGVRSGAAGLAPHSRFGRMRMLEAKPRPQPCLCKPRAPGRAGTATAQGKAHAGCARARAC